MDIQRLRELIEQLQADPSQVSTEHLGEAVEFIRTQRDYFREQEVSDDVLAGLEELRDARTLIRSEQDTRATAAAELDERRQGLLNEIADDEPAAADHPAEGESAEPATGEDPVAGEPAGQPATASEAPTDAPAEPAGEPQAVAASAKRPAPRRAPIGAFRTPKPAPQQDASLTARTVVTAAGGSPGFTQGQRLESTAQLAMAMAEKLKTVATGRGGGGGDKIYVANALTEYPDSRMLMVKDWPGNFTKIEQAGSPQALTAAGGICQPLQPLYDVEVVGSTDRPVRDALLRFGVDRGGIQYRPPASAASVLADATGVWSNDMDQSTSDTKGCYEVACPGVEEALIHAVWLCLKFKNISARFDPESTASNVQQGMIAHARKAENQLIRLIQLESKVQSAAKAIGAARDVLVNLDKASAYYRYRHRINEATSLTFIQPAWVKYLMRADIARQMAAGDWMEALGLADATIERMFRERGVVPVWHLDGGIGGTPEVQTVTVTGSPTGGTYTLTFDGQTTAAIDFDATAAEVEAALEDLSNIDTGDLTVAGGPHPGTAITVAFGGSWELTDVPLMTADDAVLTGGSSPAVGVATTTASTTTTTVGGVSIASQVYAEAAAGSAIPGFPNQIDGLLFPTGKILFLDGGTLDLGIVRDSTMNARNQYQQFSETYEGIANRAVEPLRLAMTVQPTGETAGTADTSGFVD